MSQKIISFITVLLGFTVFTGSNLYDDEYQQRRYLELQINEKRILAFSGRNQPVSVELETGERVRRNEERGYVGAVLTNRRFLAISSVSGKWLSEPYNPGEEFSAELTVGDETVIMITDERIVGFTYRRDSFVEYELPLRQRVIERESGKDFGVAVMPNRAVGLSSATGEFSEIEFKNGETFQTIETAETFALINTNRSIYSYQGPSGTWSTRPKSVIR